MRILVANKFWYRRGGLERVMFDEIRWLEAAGHQVAHFSTAHPDNDASPWSEYFAPYLELGRQSSLSVSERATAALRMFANGVARRRIDRLIETFEPDVVHIHGIHRQLSPSILVPARRRGIPVVQTLHDFHHVCPADSLLYGGSTPCVPRRCRTIWYGPAVAGRCVRGSVAQSALSAAETCSARLRRVYERSVARFVAPSAFMAQVTTAGGWELPCDVIPNAITVGSEAQMPPQSRERIVAVIGRLVPEKGVDVALEAARRAGWLAIVAGDGPAGQSLQSEYPEAEFLGHVDSHSAAELVTRARAVAVPSRVLENAPMSVLESMAAGTPVIASAIGGVPELISDGRDGLLVRAGDVGCLTEALVRLEDDGLAASLGVNASQTVAERFSPAQHLESLVACYAAAGAKGEARP